jgi:hypothetical protein
MTKSKIAKKHVSSKSSKSSTSSTSHLNPNATPAPSPEVSAPTPVLVTSAAALASAVAAAAPMTPPGDLPPAVGAPATPQQWVPTPKKKRGARGLRPRGVQVSSAQAVAKEITQSPTYVADFGSRAPAAGQVAFVVTNAAKWRDTWQGAKKFFQYASEQRAAWENDALAQMDALKPAFEYAASRDSTVAEKYAATSKYLGETNAIAERAAVVRKVTAKAEAKAGKGGQATAAASSTPPASAAPSAAPPTPAVTAPTAK